MSTGLDIAIPHSWSWTPLKFATTYLSRGTAPNYIDDGPIRAISQAANQGSGLDWQRTRFHDYNGDPRRLKGYLLPGDVLVNSTGNGTLGRVGYFREGPDEIPCIADGHVTVVRADKNTIDSRYMYYWLSSTPFQHYIYAALVVGATNQIELYRERLAGAPVPLPSLVEQRRIADFLDTETARIDGLANARKSMRNILILRRERMIEQILGLDVSPPMMPLKYAVQSVSVGIVITPANWYVAENGVPALRGLNVQPGHIDASDLVQISHEGDRENSMSRLSTRDIVVVRTGQAGAAAIVPDELDGCNCIDLLIIRTGKTTDPSFLMYYLNSFYARDKITEHSVGSIQSHFNVASMKSLEFPAIELSEQQRRAKRIDEAISDLELLYSHLEDQLELLAERRQAVITAAVTGGITV